MSDAQPGTSGSALTGDGEAETDAGVGHGRHTARPHRRSPQSPRPRFWQVRDPAAALRQLVVSAFLVVFCFVQEPRLVAADTKLDLNVDPWGFLRRALSLWDPQGAAGQLQNQAYGYLFPMGPFYGAGHSLGLPAWVVQRLWWCLVLLTAYHGARLLAGRMGIGTPGTRTLGALAYALSPRLTGGLGAISIELWPMAVAPWVLLPLVGASRQGSARRAAARSAVAVLCVGGVNAVATGAVLVLPAVFLVLRLRDAFHRRLAGWWVLFVALASLWWLVPLLLLGRYSPPFLDWIESASVTTTLSSLPEALRGTTHWIAGIVGSGGPQWPAGFALLTSRATVLAGLELAVLGCWGLLRPDLRHARFLRVGLVAGLVLLTLGHVGPLSPPWAEGLQQLLDGPLAPARNLHKFDLVARLPLALGVVHVLAVVRPAVRGAPWASRLLPAVAALAVVALAAPAAFLGVAQARSFQEVPQWWRDAARYLAQEPDRRTLLLPGSSFFVGLWGAPRDEPLQPLAKAPWLVRDAVPLGSAGATRELTAVEQLVASGEGGTQLASLLSSLGVDRVVVRADLDWRATTAPPPLVVRQALASTPGVTPGRTFGPVIGGSPRADVAVDDGMDQAVPTLQVFDVASGRGIRPEVVDADAVDVLAGGSEGVALGDAGRSWVLASDLDSVRRLRSSGGGLRTVVTDTLQRREASFASVRDVYGPALAADDDFSTPRPSHDWLTPGVRGAADQTTSVLRGATDVQASSSVATPLFGQQVQLARGPVAAFDGNGDTTWVSARPAKGSWVRISWADPQVVPTAVPVQLDTAVGADVAAVEVRTQTGTVRTPVDPVVGGTALQTVQARTAGGASRWLELRVVGVRGDLGRPVAVRDIGYGVLPGARPFLSTPATGQRPTQVELGVRADARRACVVGAEGIARCQPSRARAGEEDVALRRLTEAPAGDVTVEGTVVARPGPALDALLDSWKRVSVSSDSRWLDDPMVRPGNVADGDPSSYWASDPSDTQPTVRLRLHKARSVSGLRIDTDSAIVGRRPERVRVSMGGRTFERDVDIDGTVDLPTVRTSRVTVTITKATAATSVRTGGTQGPLPVVVGELRLDDHAWPRVAADATSGRACGFGPELDLAGRVVPTSVEGRLSDIAAGRPVTVRACNTVRLGVGRVPVVMSASAEFAPYTLVLSGARADSSRGATLLDWANHGDTSRSVEVQAADTARVLTVPENQNDGWVATLAGQRLTAIRVDGWRQAWLVPAGRGGTVHLEFSPQKPFAAGLSVGLLAALLVVAAAVVRPRRRTTGPTHHAGQRGQAVPFVLAAAGVVLMGGVWGVAALALAWALRRLLRGGEAVLLLVGVGLVAVAVWRPWPDPAATNHGGLAQALALLVVALVVTPARQLRRRAREVPPA